MKEKWIRWEPADNLAKKYYIESITERVEDKFKMILSNSGNIKKKVLIAFPHGVDAYRNADESFRQKKIYELGKLYGADFYGDWTFFKVYNSEYLEWLSQESYGWSDNLSFIHFSIIAADSIFDIACSYEPTVTFLD